MTLDRVGLQIGDVVQRRIDTHARDGSTGRPEMIGTSREMVSGHRPPVLGQIRLLCSLWFYDS